MQLVFCVAVQVFQHEMSSATLMKRSKPSYSTLSAAKEPKGIKPRSRQGFLLDWRIFLGGIACWIRNDSYSQAGDGQAQALQDVSLLLDMYKLMTQAAVSRYSMLRKYHIYCVCYVPWIRSVHPEKGQVHHVLEEGWWSTPTWSPQ